MTNKFLLGAILIATCLLTFSKNVNAQPIVDPSIFVSPYGASMGTGTGNGGFADAISPSQLLSNITDVNNPVYAGDVIIYFAGGDYYNTDFVFFPLPNTIQSITLYGGCDPNYLADESPDRDLELYETRFHATGNNELLLLGSLTYNNAPYTNTIDGITLTSDGYYVDYRALALIGGNNVISRFKIENYFTNDMLMWLETGGHTVTFTSCLFDNNDAYNLMALCTNVNLINVTIADNYFKDDMFIPFDHGYTYNLQNSIIYGNSNMDMNSEYFNVYFSILEAYKSWAVNIAGNYFYTNPIFIYNSIAPYSCDYSTSPAIAGGNGDLITLSPFYNSDLMDYDVVGVDRYCNNSQSTVDIGAYQNGNDFYSYYSVSNPLLLSKHNQKVIEKKDSIQVWSKSGIVYINNHQEHSALFYVYNMSGKLIYSGTIHSGLNVVHLYEAGTYFTKIISSEGDDSFTKFIVAQ